MAKVDNSGQDSVNEMCDGSGNAYGTVYSKSDVARLFENSQILKSHTQNFVGEEMQPVYSHRIPRNVWLKTLGKRAGLDLYFTPRAMK